MVNSVYIAHETGLYCNPLIHNFPADRKNLTDP